MTTGRKPVSCEREARARAGMPGRSPRTTAWYSGSTASTAYAYTPGRRRRARCPARSSSSANASRRAPSAPARWCARRSTSCITGFPAGSRPRASRLPVHPAGIVRRHGVPLQRLSHHASRRAWRRCSRSSSRICDRSRAARSPHGAASSQERQARNARTGQSRKMLSPPGDRGFESISLQRESIANLTFGDAPHR